MIGIATWGVIQQRERLEVEEGTSNYGYSTRRPIHYEARKYVKSPALDPNHSHFILVDDGTENQFGKEIELRAEFEACACMSKGSKEERFIADILKNKQLGWEGSRDGWTAAYKNEQSPVRDGSGRAWAEENLAICVCFEGGPGTIDTIYASTKNGTPALLVKGSGRAADLIADCIRVFRSDENDDNGGSEPNQMPMDTCDSSWLKRLVMIRRFVIFMREMKEATLRKGSAVTWPPAVEATMNSASDDPNGLWKRQWSKNSVGEWLRAKEVILEGNRRELVVDEDNRASLRPGDLAHTVQAVAIGRKLFDEYRLADWVRGAPDVKLLSIMCNLYDAICSRMCLIYDLNARTVVDGRLEHLDVLHYTVNTIALGIRADADRRAASFVLYIWRKCVTRERGMPAEEGSKHNFQENNKVLLDINSDARYLWLKLMIEWDKKDVISGLLRDTGDVHLSKRSLNGALKVALERDRCDIARDLLLYGADTNQYRGAAGRGVEAVWKGLLESACGRPENEYLKILIDRSRVEDSALCSLRTIETERLRTRRATAGRRRRLSVFYATLVDLAESAVLDVTPEGAPASALEAMREHFHQPGPANLARRSNFSARDIVDDRQAKAVLNRIYRLIVDSNDPILNGTGDDLLPGVIGDGPHSTFDTNADFDLFLCMVLVNRPELARLFWIRDGSKRASSMYQNALLACLVCRKLCRFDFVAQDKNLTSAFELTAAEYEKFSTQVLRKCKEKNVERTLSAIERPLEQCSSWTAVDVLVRADCRQLVIECSDLCISAAVRRFLGKDGFISTFSRLNSAWHAEIALFRHLNSKDYQPPTATTAAAAAAAAASANTNSANTNSLPLLTARSTRRLIFGGPNSRHPSLSGGEDVIVVPAPVNWWNILKTDYRVRLAVSVTIDAAGIAQHLWAPYSVSVVWLLLSSYLVHRLHRNTLITAVALLECQLPFLHQFPTATVACAFVSAPPDNADEVNQVMAAAEIPEAVSFFPVDHFVLDVFAHLMLTYLLTTFILMEPCLAADILEAFILLLFVSDELPDILLAGVDEHSVSIIPCFFKGFRAYWGLVGYLPFHISPFSARY